MDLTDSFSPNGCSVVRTACGVEVESDGHAASLIVPALPVFPLRHINNDTEREKYTEPVGSRKVAETRDADDSTRTVAKKKII